jgi:hypothetical protein
MSLPQLDVSFSPQVAPIAHTSAYSYTRAIPRALDVMVDPPRGDSVLFAIYGCRLVPRAEAWRDPAPARGLAGAEREVVAASW